MPYLGVRHAKPVSSFDQTWNFNSALGDRVDRRSFNFPYLSNVRGLTTKHRHAHAADLWFSKNLGLPMLANCPDHRHPFDHGCAQGIWGGTVGYRLSIDYFGFQSLAYRRLLVGPTNELARFYGNWNRPVCSSDPFYRDAVAISSLDSQN